jgi:CMP-N-acetylneuraminic acid synthetase
MSHNVSYNKYEHELAQLADMFPNLNPTQLKEAYSKNQNKLEQTLEYLCNNQYSPYLKFMHNFSRVEHPFQAGGGIRGSATVRATTVTTRDRDRTWAER